MGKSNFSSHFQALNLDPAEIFFSTLVGSAMAHKPLENAQEDQDEI